MDRAPGLQLSDPGVAAGNALGLAPLAEPAACRGDVLRLPVVDADVGQRHEPTDGGAMPALGDTVKMAGRPNGLFQTGNALLRDDRWSKGNQGVVDTCFR